MTAAALPHTSGFMGIQIRNIPNDGFLPLAAQLDGLHIRAASIDHNARLVSGNFQSAKAMPDGRIGIKLTRHMKGKLVLDSVAVPAGNDPLDCPRRTAFPVREDNRLFAALRRPDRQGARRL